MEESWWEPIITIAASSANPHREQLPWIWVIWGHSRIGVPREEVRDKVGARARRWKETHSEWGEEGRHLFASPGSFLKCRQG